MSQPDVYDYLIGECEYKSAREIAKAIGASIGPTEVACKKLLKSGIIEARRRRGSFGPQFINVYRIVRLGRWSK